MRVSKDVVNAINTKFYSLAKAKINSIPKPKHSSEDMAEDLQNFIKTEILKELPTIMAAYQKKHPSAKFNILTVCKNMNFEELCSSWRFRSRIKLDEEIAYEEKVSKVQELENKITNEIVLRLPFIKTQKEYDEYLTEVEKQFK